MERDYESASAVLAALTDDEAVRLYIILGLDDRDVAETTSATSGPRPEDADNPLAT
jgi:hypothetical protein